MIIITMEQLGPLTSTYLWFDGIGSRPQCVYNYTVLPPPLPEYLYGELNINNPGLESDGCNKLLGVIQFRQKWSEQIFTVHRFLKSWVGIVATTAKFLITGLENLLD